MKLKYANSLRISLASFKISEQLKDFEQPLKK